MSGGFPVAAIACGTNSTRLLVVDPSGVALAREMRVTRLGRGVETSRRLASETVDHTVAVLREYRGMIEALGADRVRVAATSAARDAANREAFFAAAEAAVGVRPELLSGEEEARLAFLSATASLDAAPGRALIVDIGGGSTEFAVGPVEHPPGEPDGVVSVDIGCVRLTETNLNADPPTRRQLNDALTLVQDNLSVVSGTLPTATEATQMVFVGGTVTRLPAVTRRLAVRGGGPGRHSVLTLAAVEDLLRELATQKRSHRACSHGLEVALADVMLGGTAILATTMRYFRFEECLVSEADLLDGLVLSLLDGTWRRGDSSGAAPVVGVDRDGQQWPTA